jgi:hypothetical protein
VLSTPCLLLFAYCSLRFCPALELVTLRQKLRCA